MTNRNSFLELDNWITLFKQNAGSIPIILIGTKYDLEPQEVSEEEINNYAIDHEINNVFFNSIYDDNSNKIEIFKSIVESIDPNYPLENFSLFTQKDFVSEEFKEFLRYFSVCPICNNENHYESLKNIYISSDPKLIILREQLYNAIEVTQHLSLKRRRNLKIGIPCCDCYKRFFNNK